MNDLTIQENQLELIVSEKTLGSLTTNAIQIREIVRQSLSRYDISNYSEDNISDAKKDKALLNGASKALNSKRLEIEKEFMKPFAEFKEVVNDTVKLISDCSSKIDIVVKQSETQAKELKRKVITDYFDGLNFDIVPLGRIFKDEWLNKTAKEKAIFEDIQERIAIIQGDLETIQCLPDADVLRTFYIDCLNINSTIQYANRLRLERERAEEVRTRVEEVANVQEAPKEPTKAPQGEDKAPEMLTRSFRVIGTREDIIALGDFMNERGILFDKI